MIAALPRYESRQDKLPGLDKRITKARKNENTKKHDVLPAARIEALILRRARSASKGLTYPRRCGLPAARITIDREQYSNAALLVFSSFRASVILFIGAVTIR